MLAADVYRYGQKYPPTGSAWMQFGDKELDRAMSSLSHDIQKALHQRKEVMKPLHQERLQTMGLAPMASLARSSIPSPISLPWRNLERKPWRTRLSLQGQHHRLDRRGWSRRDVSFGITRGL